MEKLAQAQEKTVDEVLADAVDKYLKDQQRQRLTAEAKRHGSENAAARNDGTVDAAISGYRREQSR